MTFNENYFYAPDAREGAFRLPEDEARHALKVLRLSADDVIYVTDGKGRIFECRISAAGKNEVQVQTLSVAEAAPEKPEIILGVGALKKPAFEALVEWACQLPIRAIVPFLAEYSQVSRESVETMVKRASIKAVTALKQSRRAFLTEIRAPVAFDELLTDHGFCVLFEKTDKPDTLDEARLRQADPVTVLIGPEGGFSPREMSEALKRKIPVFHFPWARLRAESAAFAAVITLLAKMEKTP
jgi:16S rRNA (uracil1498-N3)-methyltransferase